MDLNKVNIEKGSLENVLRIHPTLLIMSSFDGFLYEIFGWFLDALKLMWVNFESLKSMLFTQFRTGCRVSE